MKRRIFLFTVSSVPFFLVMWVVALLTKELYPTPLAVGFAILYGTVIAIGWDTNTKPNQEN